MTARTYSKRQIKEAIRYWTGKLRRMNESKEGMIHAGIRKRLAQMTDSGTPTDSALVDGDLQFLKVEKFNRKFTDGSVGERLCINTKNGRWIENFMPQYGRYPHIDELSFYSEYPLRGYRRMECRVHNMHDGLTLADIREAYNCQSDAEKILDSLPKDLADQLVQTLKGHAVSHETLNRLLGLDIDCKFYKNRDAETRWKSKTLSDIETNKKFGTQTIPADAREFVKLIDMMFGGKPNACYDRFVPNKYEEVEMRQIAVDDFETARINYRDTISPDDFYDKLLDALGDIFPAGDAVNASDLLHEINVHAKDIAKDAWDNYDPSDDYDPREYDSRDDDDYDRRDDHGDPRDYWDYQ